ncbi:MAG: hypothetical protein ABI679_04910 [Gemmatimonadota bacterium]
MRRNVLIAAGLALLGISGCGTERSLPTDPPAPGIQRPALTTSSVQERIERLARGLSQALRDPAVRHRIRASLQHSRFRENKLPFQGMLQENQFRLLHEMAVASGESEEQVEEDADSVGALELYLPVPEHRAKWTGDGAFLVATSLHDGDIPIAFDTGGVRIELDRAQPPATPVLSLVPAETDFRIEGPAAAKCTIDTCPGGGGGAPPPPTGIWLTQTAIYDLHEDWIRGSPEIEAMFMGPTTDTTKLSLLGCANESASAPRYYDQDNNFWYGNVLIADSAQLERVHAAYPPGTPWSLVRFTVAFWEDDTGRCQIATDVNTWKNKLLATGMAVLGGAIVLATDWSSPVDTEAWPFIVQLPFGLLSLAQTIGGNDDYIGIVVNRTVWNPVHPNDQVSTTQVILDGGTRSGTATIVWR